MLINPILENPLSNFHHFRDVAASLLLRTQESLATRKAKEREEWATEILKALLIGGTLAGLALILIEALPKGAIRGR